MAEISLEEYCEQIENTIEQGQYNEAVAHGKHILKQYPKHMATYRLLGKAMLDSGQSDDAADMFRRVLSANPEDLVAWIGMSELHAQRGEFDAAAWYLERAFEQAADNELLEEELRKLYGRRDGMEPSRVQLTRGALARLYLKGDLLSRAINEFRDLLDEHPERVDLSVALAEALWRNEQRLEASEVCQQLLDELPYCIKANLILGEIWTSSGREEGQTYLRRAEALDPENRMAQTLFGAASPLHPREAHIAPLEPPSAALEERPAWLTEAETTLGAAEGERALVDIASALETQIEIPSWLTDAASEETPAPPVADTLAAVPPAPTVAEPLPEQPPVERLVEEAIPTPTEAVPDWLAGIGEELPEKAPGAIAPAEIEPPDWLAELGLEPTGAEEIPEPPPGPPPAPLEEPAPDWLSGIRDQFTEEAEIPPEAVAETEGVSAEWMEPDWLEAEAVSLVDESLSWLEQPAETLEEKAATPLAEEAISAPAEIPDWMQELAPPEEAAPVAPVAEEPPTPDWLTGDETPSGDEALAWLEQLTAGKEDELQAQAQAEAEARMAEIMGRPAPAEPPAVEAAPEEIIAPLVEEAIPTPAEIPDWMQELAPPEEAAPVAPVAEEPPTPDWLTGDETPSGDEALAWLEQLTAGKEDELQAQAQAEAEARMAEIMGRPAPAEPPAVEAAPEEIIAPPVEEAIPAPAEIPDWMQELTPPEEAPVTPVAEEAPAPDWLEGEGVPSGDEALAWLEQLTAGKEDELQAQAQAEAEARMAEIMGRPAPAEPPVAKAVPEEIIAPPPVEEAVPAPAEIPDWMQELAPPDVTLPEAAPPITEAAPEEAIVPSAEEAFGWIAFGEPEAPPQAIAAVDEALLPVEAVVPTAEEAPTPDWLEGEGIPSGDEALAWLEQLAAGKEDELQAQAQAEAEARMAEIMGRPAPAEPPMVEAVPEEITAPPVEEAIPAPAEIPDWMQELAPPEEAPVTPVAEEVPTPDWLAGDEIPSGDEALAWLEQLTAGKEDELQAQAQAEAEARMAEIMGRPAPAEPPVVEAVPEEITAPPPVEETFGWTAFGEPETPAVTEAAPEEIVAPPVEKVAAVTEIVPQVKEFAPPEIPEPEYLEDEQALPTIPAVEAAPPPEEILAPEIAPPVEEVRREAAAKVTPEKVITPTPAVEEAPSIVEMEAPTPPEKVAAPPEPPIAEPPTPAEPFATERAYLKEHPRDYEARLSLARALWQADERQEALEAYTQLIRAGKPLENVIPDLEGYLKQWPGVDVQRALGDAYMKDGRLQKALETYRRALETL